jgi:outer membrane murein-binding lipoprotein Lpp
MLKQQNSNVTALGQRVNDEKVSALDVRLTSKIERLEKQIDSLRDKVYSNNMENNENYRNLIMLSSFTLMVVIFTVIVKF